MNQAVLSTGVIVFLWLAISLGGFMGSFILGAVIGSIGTWFVNRFRESLLVMKKRTEKKIEDSLKGQ